MTITALCDIKVSLGGDEELSWLRGQCVKLHFYSTLKRMMNVHGVYLLGGLKIALFSFVNVSILSK